jgi:hypothetical protein
MKTVIIFENIRPNETIVLNVIQFLATAGHHEPQYSRILSVWLLYAAVPHGLAPLFNYLAFGRQSPGDVSSLPSVFTPCYISWLPHSLFCQVKNNVGYNVT